MHSLGTGNYLLILFGFGLIALGPYVLYQTIRGVRKQIAEHPEEKVHWFSNFINVLIGIVCFWAGILFVINNLRGNPFANVNF